MSLLRHHTSDHGRALVLLPLGGGVDWQVKELSALEGSVLVGDLSSGNSMIRGGLAAAPTPCSTLNCHSHPCSMSCRPRSTPTPLGLHTTSPRSYNASGCAPKNSHESAVSPIASSRSWAFSTEARMSTRLLEPPTSHRPRFAPTSEASCKNWGGCIPSWRHARCSAALVTTHADTHWNFGSDASSRKCPRHTRRDGGVPPLIELDLRKDRQF